LKTPGGAASSTPLKKLGSFVYRRRKYVIVAWVIALVAVLPIIVNVGKSTSLQLGSAGGSQLESVKADGVISSQFAKTVPNSTLLVVITGQNVSSLATQALIRNILGSVKSDKNISGLIQSATLDVYSRLYSTIISVNGAAYAAREGANSTSQLLLGVPALYFESWEQASAASYNVTVADSMANQSAATTLSAANSTAYRLYSSHVLAPFYSCWADPSNAALNVTVRLSLCAGEADASYLQTYAGSSRAFGEEVLKSITMSDFLSDTPAQAASRVDRFAVGYVANTTSFTSRFVNATFSLGQAYDNTSLYTLAGDIVRNPSGFGAGPSLSTLIDSFVSPARNLTIVSLGLNQSSNQNLLAIRVIAQSALLSAGKSSGVQSVQVTGQDAISYDFGNSIQGDITIIFVAAIVLLIVATGLFFRSVLTPFITLGTIGVALGISQVFIVVVSTFVAKVDFTAPVVLLTILIGVGTDYSVFVIARYREERVKGYSVQEAIETSITWAGESITTSGATVIISFLALALTSVVLLRSMGFVVGLGVLVALAVALTLVPAIIGVVGGRAFWPTSGERFSRYSTSVLSKLESKRGYFSRSGTFSVKRAKVLIVLAFLVSVPTFYVYSTTTPTYDFLSAAPSSLQSISASNSMAAAFGSGRLYPTYVVVAFDHPLVTGDSFNSTEMGTISAISDYIAGYRDVRNITGPTRPFGSPVSYESLIVSSPSGVLTFSAIMQQIGSDKETALITVNFGVNPLQTAAISDAQSMRQYLHANFGPATGVTGIYVGGASGSMLDTKNTFDSEFNSVVPIVAIGVALVLLVVLGSLFLPVFAVLSILMSVVWTLVATKLVFQAYFNYPILFILPFLLFVTLLGLGMDYNIFILTRIREEATKGGSLNDAIIKAIEQTGGIITAAAIILAGSLGALVLSSDLLLRQMGFAFAFSILVDALIVRTYLVPAVMSTVGRWNWFSPIPYLNRSHSLFKRDDQKSP
jgi:RND superfamily putative drug exporter